MTNRPTRETEQRAGHILRHLKLSPKHLGVLKSARRLNPTLPDLPYHCADHGIRVMTTFADLAVGLISQGELRHGLLAALYHDAAHPGSADDGENTQSAAAFWLAHAPVDQHIDRGAVAARTIRSSTRVSESDLHGTAAQLLHDADLLQTVVGTPAERAHWQQQLALEFQVPVTECSSLEFVQPRLLTQAAGRLLAKQHR